MKRSRVVLVITLAVFCFPACSNSDRDHNANQSANQNSAGAISTVPTPTVPTVANANANEAARPPGAYPASGSGEPAANANQAAQPPGNNNQSAGGAQQAAAIDAAALFNEQSQPKCARCHGTDGKGKLKGTPNFTDPAWQAKESDAELIEQIKKGDKPMPAYGGKLTDEQIQALVAYVRSFAKQ